MQFEQIRPAVPETEAQPTVPEQSEKITLLYEANKKRVGTAYLLLVLGWLGVHRLYLKQNLGWAVPSILLLGVAFFLMQLFLSPNDPAISVLFSDPLFLMERLTSPYIPIATRLLVMLGLFCFLVGFVWILADFFSLYKWAEQYNNDLLKNLIHDGSTTSLSPSGEGGTGDRSPQHDDSTTSLSPSGEKITKSQKS